MGLNQSNFAPHLHKGKRIYFYKKARDKVEIALMRLREFEPEAGYYLAFSGGKDSQVIYDLALRAGVKFEPHYNMAIDPPELIRFMRQYYPDVTASKYPGFNFYIKLAEKGFPTRRARWCCEYMKEWGGAGRIVVTGVRWQESTRRKARRMVDVGGRGRLAGEQPTACVNPIIDWTVKEVWEYLRCRELPYCELYDVGASGPYRGDGDFKRLGCVLCPMESPLQTQRELLYFPKQAAAWRAAFDRLWERRVAAGSESIKRWASAEEMWLWWLSRENQGKPDDRCMSFW